MASDSGYREDNNGAFRPNPPSYSRLCAHWVEKQMQSVRPADSGKSVGSEMIDGFMSFEDFVRIFRLPPIVPIKIACANLGCGHSKLYKMREEGRLRIVPRAGGTGVPVIDLHRIYVGDVKP
jgi:hypothetical protein